MERAHNFSAGPCILPQSVIEELSSELPNFGDTGMSIIEMSHRDPAYDAVHQETLSLFRELCDVPEDFSILLLQGGATLQFAMVPMNLLSSGTAAYTIGGTWAKKAIADAEKIGPTAVAWSGADENFTRMPTVEELNLPADARYLHITSNETIGGIRIPEFYKLDGVPQVGDMSSDYLTRPIPWDLFDVVYGGAQKNLGPAGLTVVFVRNSILEAIPSSVPSYLSYAVHAKAESVANTPPVFSIWATGKMLKWIKDNGGVQGMEKAAEIRSGMVYDAIDSSDGFYNSPVETASRSHTNVVFTLDNDDLQSRFLAGASEASMTNLKGHRSVGGMRASIYNALPTSSVETLVEYMNDFAAANG